MTTDEFIAQARALHGDRYGYEKTVFSTKQKKVTVTCSVHGDFETVARCHLAGSHCLKCSGKAKKTVAEFARDARAVHGDRYDYSKVVYKNNSSKVEIGCALHGSFWMRPITHIQNKAGCPPCAGVTRTTLDDFLTRARSAHGDRYDYSKVEYRDVDSKVTIVCPDHGEFSQIPYDHWKGRGCVQCGILKCAGSNRTDQAEFIHTAKAAHGDIYDYSHVHYVNSITKIEIGCQEHGSFFQTPSGHLDSTGCPMCSTVAPVSKDEFIRRAKAVHGNKYDYTATDFLVMHKKATVFCPDHGIFRTMPKDHVAKGAGCPQCAREATSSTGEREVADWLASIGVKIVRNDRTTLDGFEIDIFIPSQNIGIEFQGAYWHHADRLQHPRMHEVKALRADKTGVQIIAVWDYDWSTRPQFIKSMMLHRLRIDDGQKKISARSCTVSRVDVVAASAFYERTHIQGKAWRSIANYGLFNGSDLVACMSFSQGSSRRGKSGNEEWELTRFSTDGLVRGGASKLFAAFTNEYDPQVVWSFSDRQHFSGGIYPVLGFVSDGLVAADYRVHHQASGKTWHKSAWQRKHIPKRLLELGIDDVFDPATDPRTERDMQARAKALRIMDAGKVRWKWQQKSPD